jgi:hypothetical protein
MMLGGVAYAQGTAPGRGYVEAVAQSAFGNVTTQAYGVELGFNLQPEVRLFVEAGRVRNTAPADLTASAQAIATFLSQTQGTATFTASQPVNFGVAGVQYLFPTNSPSVTPYVMAGGGVAQVKKAVTFAVGGTDVTSTIGQLGVVLGTDLSGSAISPMIDFGGGVAWSPWKALIFDFQFRYGRVFAEDGGINVTRAGLGLGVRF